MKVEKKKDMESGHLLAVSQHRASTAVLLNCCTQQSEIPDLEKVRLSTLMKRAQVPRQRTRLCTRSTYGYNTADVDCRYEREYYDTDYSISARQQETSNLSKAENLIVTPSLNKRLLYIIRCESRRRG